MTMRATTPYRLQRRRCLINRAMLPQASHGFCDCELSATPRCSSEVVRDSAKVTIECEHKVMRSIE